MINIKFIGLLFLAVCFLPEGDRHLEKECYKRFIKEGKQAFEAGKYDLAVYKFEAAKICPDKPGNELVDELIKEVTDAKIEVIDKARKLAEREQEKARLAKKETERLLILSEGSIMAFQSNVERDNGNHEAAVRLSYMAMQISDDKMNHARRAFGDATYQNTLARLEDHKGPVQEVEFAPDGQHFLSVSEDQSVILWRLPDEKLFVLDDFELPVRTAIFSPDGKHFLTVHGNLLRLWNLTGELIHKTAMHKDIVLDVAFSKNGKWIASCSRDKSIRLWDWKMNKQQAVCVGHKAAIRQLSFHPEQPLLLSLASDKTVRLWDMNGQQVLKVEHKNLHFSGAEFGVDPNHLITHTIDYAIQIWDVKSERLINEVRDHKGLIRGLAVAPDGSGFLTCGEDSVTVMRTPLGEAVRVLDNHSKAVISAKYSRDGNYFLTCSKDGTAKLHDNSGQLLMNIYDFQGAVRSVDMSPDNEHIVTAGQNTEVQLCMNPDIYYLYLQQSPPQPLSDDERKKYNLITNSPE